MDSNDDEEDGRSDTMTALDESWSVLKRTRTSDGSVPYSAGYVPSFYQASQDVQGLAQIGRRNAAARDLDSVADEEVRRRPLLFGRKKSKEEEQRLRSLADEARDKSRVQQMNIDFGMERGHHVERTKVPQDKWSDGTRLSSVPSSYDPRRALEGRRTTAERPPSNEGGDLSDIPLYGSNAIEGFYPYKYPKGYSGSYPFSGFGGAPSGAPDDGAGITRDRGSYPVPEGASTYPNIADAAKKGPSLGGIEDPVSPNGQYYYDYETQQWVLNQ
jgi:hypothetical protein